MGGHGGLNILPQKRWNVYRRDNRLRVRRDEEQHREEQQQRRQQDERQRMSNVLILLKRKKAEAQARRQQRHSATTGDTKAQVDNVQPSTTSSCSQSDGSHAAWLSTLVDFGGSCRSFSTVSDVVRCGQPGVARCHAGVGDHDRESSVTGPSCSVSRDGPSWAHSSCSAEVAALSACRGASSMPSGCVCCAPAGGCSSNPGAEVPGEALESLIVDHPGVVRVRLPTTTYTRADTVVPPQNSHAVVASSAAGFSADTSLQCVAYATSLETGIECVECEAQVVNQPNAAVDAGHTVTSAAVDTPPPQEQQQLAKEQSQHVNLFEAEENEMRKLELRRKKYLLSAGYTPGARSEFEGEIRASLTQTPWYYRPPSASKPPAFSSLLHTKEFLGPGLPHYWPQVLQQVPGGSGEEAVTKQHPAAALPTEFAEQDRGPKEQGQDGETCRSGYPPETLTSPQPVPVHLEGQHEREEQHCYSRKSDALMLKCEPSRRLAGDSNGKDKGRNVLTRESRKKTKRLRKDKRASVDRQKDEDAVECLQVTLLVEDEEEDGVS